MAEKEDNKKSEVALREERVLEFWQKNKIFQQSLRQNEGGREFVFYDGPATANAVPPLHSLVPRIFKDAIPRYKTMRGYHVRRKVGWDTHGLPVELQIEKKLGLKSKKEIEEYGIAKFNRLCRDSVWEFIGEWNKFTARSGYWIDFENPYITYENSYIESLWSIVKKIENKKLLYRDYKVVPWCPRCGTGLSSHELAQGYEDVKDLSIYVKFHLKPGQKYGKDKTTKDADYILAWTTTPWTLPGNVALAVGEDLKYTALRVAGVPELNIVASDRVESLFRGKEIEIVHDDLKGFDLEGLEYEPLFPYLKEQVAQKGEPTGKMFKVYPANFVNTEDGTGVVHTAVMYGQDDFVLGTKVGLPKRHLVNPEGKFVKGTGFLEGRFVKEKNEEGKPTLDVDIIKYLTEKNYFFSKENYQHSYPHCWRCKTALIYYARDSWYIRMSDPKIKKQLINENKTINWEPAHIRDGRFGEWLREIKDWAISRERYWGTPLPVWVATDGERLVVDSIETLKKYSPKSGNKYFVMRHGESEKNLADITNSTDIVPSPLTPKGKESVQRSAEALRREDIDYIFVSPLLRTKQTAEIVARAFGLPNENIIVDKRLIEINVGEFDNKPESEYRKFFSAMEEQFIRAPKGGETLVEVKRRMGDFIYEIEKKLNNKNILIISHDDTIWMLESAVAGLTNKQSLEHPSHDALKMGEFRSIFFAPLPHNENYELDLHKPYIDEVALFKDGKEFKRTSEVMDVWFDSGGMPFAQDHYPFENSGWVDGRGYPADYISEAIDQTRGWFYTLHAVGVLMGRGKAYKNVICLGHLLDAEGKKMSKSLGNVVDPWVMMDKYGVDTLRLWMYSVNQPGESKNFDEKTVQLLSQQTFGLLYNVLTFYELYRDKDLETSNVLKSKNILDQWILARLDELVRLATENLDKYKLLEPTRGIRDFIGDLSTWYLRRSRERIKEGDKEAKQTLYFVLKTLIKVLAPLAPFAAEDIWLTLKGEQDVESVHLTSWPRKRFKIFPWGRAEVLESMEAVRHVVTLGLEARQNAGIKVRQPLNRIEIIAPKLSTEYIEIIKDELNIKNIDYVLKIKIGLNKVNLDTNITDELKQEGDFREFSRAIQDLRKKRGLTPSDFILLTLQADAQGRELVQQFESDLKKNILASEIKFNENDGEEIKANELVFRVRIDKI